jgi:hypothetical protein
MAARRSITFDAATSESLNRQKRKSLYDDAAL